MPGNTIKINNYDALEWYVGDSKMPLLMELLNCIGMKTDKAKETEEEQKFLTK